MHMVKRTSAMVVVLCTVLLVPVSGYGWTCRTHAFIAKQAGMRNPEYACIPDASRHDNYGLLLPFHYHSAAPDAAVDSAYIDRYTVKEAFYVPKTKPGARPIKIKVPHEAGVLYWKIIERYRILKTTEARADYDYAVMGIAHFIGDLAQPLHNYPHGAEPAGDGKVYREIGAWASSVHDAFDGRFDAVTNPVLKIKTITIASEDALRREVARLANESIALANRCYNDDPSKRRGMTDAEVTSRIEDAVSLLQAVLADCRRTFAK
jgi:hypothetical protein